MMKRALVLSAVVQWLVGATCVLASETPPESQGELETASEAPFLEDIRNYVSDNLDASAIESMFDASAEIELDLGNRQLAEQGHEIIAGKSAMGALPEEERKRYELLLALNLAQARLAAAIEPYRRLNLPADGAAAEKPAIRLGAAGREHEPLGANINNYAPDKFVDKDVMRLFEMHREVREQLASDLATGECRLDVAELRALNREVRESFKKAMLDYAPAVEISPTPPPSPTELDDGGVANGDDDDDQEECAICRERLALEPCAELPCGHVYHKGCLASWARIQDTVVNTCPRCRDAFRLPYRMAQKLSTQDVSGRAGCSSCATSN